MSSPHLQAFLQCLCFVKRQAISGNADVNVCSCGAQTSREIGRVSGLVPDKYKRRTTYVLAISGRIAATLTIGHAEYMLYTALLNIK